jgi:flavin-binding protein dodecin
MTSHILYYDVLPLNYLMTHIAKIIEIVGSSDKGAAQVSVDEAKKTLHGIHGIEITDMTAKVDPDSGKITQYRAAVKVAFGVEH